VGLWDFECATVADSGHAVEWVAGWYFGVFPKISTPVENIVENRPLSIVLAQKSRFLAALRWAKGHGSPTLRHAAVVERQSLRKNGALLRRKSGFTLFFQS
jgi:hypothetical protein